MEDELCVEVSIKIPFYDVDMMRISWHGNYLKYFEDARCALLDKIGYNYTQMEQSGYMWPIVDCRIKYVKPVRFNQVVNITATLVEYENRIKINYRITDLETGVCLTKGYTIQVAVDLATQKMCFVSPEVLLEKLR